MVALSLYLSGTSEARAIILNCREEQELECGESKDMSAWNCRVGGIFLFLHHVHVSILVYLLGLVYMYDMSLSQHVSSY